MSAPEGSGYQGLSKDSFDALGWPSLIAAVPIKECKEYAKGFSDRAKASAEANQADPARAARVLAEIATFGFHPSEPDRPFGPMIQIGNQRSALPEDFPPDLIAILSALVPEAGDPEFAARLGDVVITQTPKRDTKLIEATIGAYLASGAHLFQQGRWDAGYLRFRRAIHLTRKPSPALAQAIKSAFDGFVANTAPAAPLLEVVQMLELYRDDISGDAAALAAQAATFAKKAADANAWHLCRRFHALSAHWLKAQGQQAAVSAALVEAAETHVKLAEEAMQRPTPSPLVAADHLLRAARAHREIDKSSTRAAEIDRLRASRQQEGIKAMQWVNLAEQPDSAALKEAVQNVENAMRMAAQDAALAAQGLPFYDALRLLALCHPPPDRAKSEATAVANLKKGVWTSMMPVTLYDEEGRPFVKAGSFIHADPKGQRLVIEQRMLEWFTKYHVPETVTIFEAIREQLTNEHQIMPSMLEPIITHSPFIPEGRGYFFARGLYAGLTGDFPLAGNFLAPQLEYAIKAQLQAAGVIPTITEKSETERPADLNYLFNAKRKEIEAVFGADETFELEALLIRRWGCHLRNDIAHGELTPWDFYQPPTRYLWWITLRFCMFGAAPLPKPPPGGDAPS